jgi:hypothetical protein
VVAGGEAVEEWEGRQLTEGPWEKDISVLLGLGEVEFFIYLFYHDFAKIYGPPQILQKYTSAAVAHSVKDKNFLPIAVGAARSWPVPLTLWATTLCP